MTYEQLVNAFLQTPAGQSVEAFSPEWNDLFNQHYEGLRQQAGVEDFADIPEQIVLGQQTGVPSVAPELADRLASSGPSPGQSQPAQSSGPLGEQGLIDWFQANIPGAQGKMGSPAWQQLFNEFIGPIAQEKGIQDWSQLTAADLDEYEYVGPPPEQVGALDQTPAEYTGLREWFIENVPGGNQQVDSAEWNDRFNAVMSEIASDLGLERWEDIPVGELSNYEYVGQGGPTSTEVPLEQGLLDQILPNLLQDIEDDNARREQANQLREQLRQDTGAVRDTLGQTMGGGFDARTYFERYPDVAAAYQENPGGLTPEQFAEQHYLQNGINEGRTPAYTPSARLAQENYQAGVTGDAISQAAADAAAARQSALGTSIESMLGNLGTQVDSRNVASNELISRMTQNLGELDATQRAALEQQLRESQTSLERENIAQRQSLERELQASGQAFSAEYDQRLAALQNERLALEGAVDARSQARRAALDAEIQSLQSNREMQTQRQRAALEQELEGLRNAVDAQGVARREALQREIAALGEGQERQTSARRAALQQEISQLRTATDEASQARRAALQSQLADLDAGLTDRGSALEASLAQEIEGLRAAQEPYSQARLGTAEALTTGINLGLEETLDQLVANRALQGYIGSSTGDVNAATRATIDARQRAAQAMAGAREANASDVRDIDVRAATNTRMLADALANDRYGLTTFGAGERRSLADELARQLQEVATREALEGRSISDQDAAGMRAISDREATGARTIEDQIASGLFEVDSRGATEGRSISNQEADALRMIQDRYATEGRSIDDQTSGSIYDIATRAATGERTLADILAESQRNLAVYGAGEERSLADRLATGTRSISDYGSSEGRNIANATGQAQYGISNLGATNQYDNALYGADQTRSLMDTLASGTYGISSDLANQQQSAATGTAQARQAYFDNDFSRAIQAANYLPALTTNLIAGETALDAYGNTGTNRALNTLNWWSTGTNAPPSPNFLPEQASTLWGDIGNLGSALVGAGLNWWNSNNNGIQYEDALEPE